MAGTNKKSWVWKYFSKKYKDTATCNVCQKVVRRKTGNTSAMIAHYNKEHDNVDKASTSTSDTTQPLVSLEANCDSGSALTQSSSSNSSQPSGLTQTQSVKKRKLDSNNSVASTYFQAKSLGEILAECAAKNGFSVAAISECDAIKGYLRTKGFEMPRSETTIWKLIMDFHADKLAKQKQEICEKVKRGVRFSISLDEWTDIVSKRYLMVILHDLEVTYHLCLIPTPETCSIENGIEMMMKPRNKQSDCTLERDIKALEGTGIRTPRLQNLYDALLSIQPTSTSCEQVFSVAGIIKTKIRNRLSPEKLNSLVWLKNYFKKST